LSEKEQIGLVMDPLTDFKLMVLPGWWWWQWAIGSSPHSDHGDGPSDAGWAQSSRRHDCWQLEVDGICEL